MSEKTVMILGSTGSVGKQAADVAKQAGYRVSALSANRNVDLLERQIRELSPLAVAVTDTEAAGLLRGRISDLDTKIYVGEDGQSDMIGDVEADVAVNSVYGFAGLRPTLDVIASGKRLALANKESLVIAGDIVMKSAAGKGCLITPVDSEHSAIFQAMRAGKHSEIKKLILTASGGPFFGKKRDELASITVEQALAHPTWKMGAAITVDSATLMNKGFEVIEASKLFSVPAEKIGVLVHRESVVHSLVEYEDNSFIAQMSDPDMRLCVQYAIEYPDRRPAVISELDLARLGTLSFYEPDEDTFIPLRLARQALEAGGGVPAVLHAANECAVAAFLEKKIGFTDIMDCLEYTLAYTSGAAGCASLEEILEADASARALAGRFIDSRRTNRS